MRKTFVLAFLMLSLLTLMALMPVVEATAYTWDGLCFGEGQMLSGLWIKYPHPRRDIYGISPYSGWTKQGTKLWHNQMDHDTSEITRYGIVAVMGVMGITIGLAIGGGYGGAIGGVIGIALGFIVSGSSVVLQDELGCVWWWISISFMNWVKANLWWLGPIASIAPSTCVTFISSAFALYGYLRVGPVTFYDAVGAGNPAPPPPSGGGGCPILSVYNGEEYIEEGLIDIHATEDVIRTHTLTVTPQLIHNAILLRLTEHPETHSHIDQVRLFATLEDGRITELRLISAIHSEEGNVLPKLLFSDDVRMDTLGAELNNGTSQSIDLKFSGVPLFAEVESFTFIIEGYNHIAKR